MPQLQAIFKNRRDANGNKLKFEPEADDNVCVICHEPYHEGNTPLLFHETCGQVYHKHCIDSYYKTNRGRAQCPTCRGSDQQWRMLTADWKESTETWGPNVESSWMNGRGTRLIDELWVKATVILRSVEWTIYARLRNIEDGLVEEVHSDVALDRKVVLRSRLQGPRRTVTVLAQLDTFHNLEITVALVTSRSTMTVLGLIESPVSWNELGMFCGSFLGYPWEGGRVYRGVNLLD